MVGMLIYTLAQTLADGTEANYRTDRPVGVADSERLETWFSNDGRYAVAIVKHWDGSETQHLFERQI